MKPKQYSTFILVLFVCLLAGCRGSPESTSAPVSSATPLSAAVPLPTATPLSAATPTPYAITNPKLVDIGNGVQFLINCVGDGEPTIILENSYMWLSWDESLANQISTISRTCRYLRYGSLNEPGGDKRTFEDQVRDLHSLLAEAAIPGPYVLVGHATSGFNIALYTFHFPEEVVGLVCVDCNPPTYQANLLHALGEAKPDEPDQFLIFRDYFSLVNLYVEKIDFSASEEQVLKVNSLGDVPFIVLVAEKSFTRRIQCSHPMGLTKSGKPHLKPLASFPAAAKCR